MLTELPSLSTTTSAAEGEVDKEFPNADKNKIKFIMDRKGRTRVGLISPKKPYYNLLTQIPGKSREYRVNPQLPKEVLRALGESRRQAIQEEIGRLSEGIIENKKIAEDTTKGLFKAAGGAISFLAEHTWLLILAVVAFLFKKLMKRR